MNANAPAKLASPSPEGSGTGTKIAPLKVNWLSDAVKLLAPLVVPRTSSKKVYHTKPPTCVPAAKPVAA
jgi:hypothetical protein